MLLGASSGHVGIKRSPDLVFLTKFLIALINATKPDIIHAGQTKIANTIERNIIDTSFLYFVSIL
nr:MAG TPA: hypothetical protein [Bacteriophage sp.]